MNTARIVDLAIATGAGSLAAQPASGQGGKAASNGPAPRFFAPYTLPHFGNRVRQ